jgi:hypothetical protein
MQEFYHFRKEKGRFVCPEFTQASKSLFFSLNKVPAAACWVYVEIPHSIQSSIKPPNLNNRIFFWGKNR